MNSIKKTIGKKGIFKALAAILAALCILTSLPLSAAAEESEETADASVNAKVNDARTSLMQVKLVYVDKSEKKEDKQWIKSGTGFLINENTLLTCAHVVDFDNDVKSTLNEIYGSNWKKSNLSVEAVVSNDVTIKANVKKASSDLDFAVLTLTEPIYGRNIAPLADSDTVKTTQKVYALGFPVGVVQNTDTETFTPDDVTITYGSVTKVTRQLNYNAIVHEARITEGNSGGPLLNEAGEVLGITNRKDNALYAYSHNGEPNGYAVSINQIKAIFDSLGIKYTKPEGSENKEDTESEDETTEAETETAKPIETEPETKEVIAPTSATQPITENNGGNDMIKWIIIAAIAVLVIVLAVVIVMIILKNNKKPSGGSGNGSSPSAPKPSDLSAQPGMQNPAINSNIQQPVPPQARQGNPFQGSPMPLPNKLNDEGIGETSVLSDGAGETSVLGYQAIASMVRKSNGEKVVINKPEFTIGKERRRVDYCIQNNNSVSRRHAQIRCRAGKCYILDLGSTNFTYVNGAKLSPNQEIELSKGDIIKISDEEFEFMG